MAITRAGRRPSRAITDEDTAILGRVALLTARERQILELLQEGRTSKEIATALNLSTRTVEGHRRSIVVKLQVTSTKRLVRALRASHDTPTGR
jgi:DNA-binding NarL/FixJ family response regulator